MEVHEGNSDISSLSPPGSLKGMGNVDRYAICTYTSYNNVRTGIIIWTFLFHDLLNFDVGTDCPPDNLRTALTELLWDRSMTSTSFCNCTYTRYLGTTTFWINLTYCYFDLACLFIFASLVELRELFRVFTLKSEYTNNSRKNISCKSYQLFIIYCLSEAEVMSHNRSGCFNIAN